MYMYKVKKMSSQRKNTIKNKYNFISEYLGKKNDLCWKCKILQATDIMASAASTAVSIKGT